MKKIDENLSLVNIAFENNGANLRFRFNDTVDDVHYLDIVCENVAHFNFQNSGIDGDGYAFPIFVGEINACDYSESIKKVDFILPNFIKNNDFKQIIFLSGEFEAQVLALSFSLKY